MDMRFGTWNVRITETILVARKFVRYKLDFMIVKEHRFTRIHFQGGWGQKMGLKSYVYAI
jgi:hypothetical protein